MKRGLEGSGDAESSTRANVIAPAAEEHLNRDEDKLLRTAVRQMESRSRTLELGVESHTSFFNHPHPLAQSVIAKDKLCHTEANTDRKGHGLPPREPPRGLLPADVVRDRVAFLIEAITASQDTCTSTTAQHEQHGHRYQ